MACMTLPTQTMRFLWNNFTPHNNHLPGKKKLLKSSRNPRNQESSNLIARCVLAKELRPFKNICNWTNLDSFPQLSIMESFHILLQYFSFTNACMHTGKCKHSRTQERACKSIKVANHCASMKTCKTATKPQTMRSKCTWPWFAF